MVLSSSIRPIKLPAELLPETSAEEMQLSIDKSRNEEICPTSPPILVSPETLPCEEQPVMGPRIQKRYPTTPPTSFCPEIFPVE